MNLKRYLFALTAFVVFFLILEKSFSTSDENDVGEALEALDFWAKARAYPNKFFPQKGYAQAFEEKFAFESKIEQQPWEEIGPKNFGGRTISIAINPQNNRTVYAGSASGGLWRSFTAGEGASAWQRVETGFPVLGVGAIAISQTDTNLMFIGTGEVYAYQNSTGGIVNRLTRGSYGIGILKTTDGGLTWSKSLDWSMHQERGVQVIKINPLNQNTIYAGTTEGIFVSHDCGNTWVQKSGIVMVTDLVINPIDTNQILMACGNFNSPHKGIYFSTNGGENWQIAEGVPTDYEGKVLFSQFAANPDIVYASVGHGLSGTTLIKTTDFGRNWTTVSVTDYARYQGWFAHIVVAHPEDENKIIVGGVDLFKSTDGGINFVQKSYWWAWFNGRTIAGEEEGPEYYSHADHHCYAIDLENPDVVYFGNDGGIFKTTDFGETFHGRNGGYQSQQFYNGFSASFIYETLAMGGLQDNASAIYDGETNWIRVIGGDGCWTAINKNNSDIMFGSYQKLNVVKSINRGESWGQVSLPPTGTTAFVAPFVISNANQNVMYAAGSKVVMSTDGGRTWSVIGQPSVNPAISMATSWQNQNTVYVGFAPENGTLDIAVTRNGGNTWQNVAEGLPNRYPMDIAVDPTDDNRVYVVFSGFGTSHVFRTDDGGENWIDINGDLPDIPTNAVIVDPDFPNYVYLGNDLGVYVSSDYGETWHAMFDGLPQAVMVMDLKPAYGESKIIAATHGNGAYITDLVSAVEVQNNKHLPENFILYQNYPNPFNPTTTIKYSIPANAGVETQDFASLRIYNVLGEEIATLVNERQSPGNYTVQFNASNLPSGTYFYTLRVGDFVATKKMILLK